MVTTNRRKKKSDDFLHVFRGNNYTLIIRCCHWVSKVCERLDVRMFLSNKWFWQHSQMSFRLYYISRKEINDVFIAFDVPQKYPRLIQFEEFKEVQHWKLDALAA